MKSYCPYCRKEVEYSINTRKVEEFKGYKVDTYENYGICCECEKELFIPDLEDENTFRINDKYREKANIISIKELVEFRKKYMLSQRELTAILAFGKMTINRYENGEVPSKAQSDYLKILMVNDSEFRKIVKEAYELGRITEKTYKKVVDKEIDTLYELKKNEIIKALDRDLDIYNGYKKIDLDLVENIVSYIASKVDNLTITSINKYLWYIDMICFKNNGVSLTGLTYEKQKFGPTIINHKYEDISILSDKYYREDEEDENGNLKTKIISKNNFSLNGINEEEKKIIDMVIQIFKDKKVNEISDISHKEKAWKDKKIFENISYDDALDLKYDI